MGVSRLSLRSSHCCNVLSPWLIPGYLPGRCLWHWEILHFFCPPNSLRIGHSPGCHNLCSDFQVTPALDFDSLREESNTTVPTNHSSPKPQGSQTPNNFATVFGERTWVSIALWAFSWVQWCISMFLASWQALHSLQVTILNPPHQGFLCFVLSFGAGVKTPRQYKKASS